MNEPFFWSSGGQKLSATEVARNRAVAEALMNRVQNPQNMWEGLQSAAGDIGGSLLNWKSDKAEEEGRSAVADALLQAQGGSDPNAYISILGNEFASPAQSAVAQALLQRGWSQQDRAAADAVPDFNTFEQGGDVFRWNEKDPNAKPELWFDGPDPLPEPPKVESFYDEETGRNVKRQWGPNGWETVGGVEAPKDPLVTVNTGDGADSALNKALSTGEGEQWATYKKAGTVSAANAQDFEILDQLIDVAPQGPIVGPLAATFKGFSSAGEAFQSVVKRVAPTLRVEGSGATSDIEYDGMLQSLPALANTPEGNRMINEIMKAKAQINMARSEIISSYQAGEIDVKEARRQMNALDRQPLLSPDMKKALLGIGATEPEASAAPAIGEVVDGYEYLGGDPASPTSWKRK